MSYIKGDLLWMLVIYGQRNTILKLWIILSLKILLIMSKNKKEWGLLRFLKKEKELKIEEKK